MSNVGMLLSAMAEVSMPKIRGNRSHKELLLCIGLTVLIMAMIIALSCILLMYAPDIMSGSVIPVDLLNDPTPVSFLVDQVTTVTEVVDVGISMEDYKQVLAEYNAGELSYPINQLS